MNWQTVCVFIVCTGGDECYKYITSTSMKGPNKFLYLLMTESEMAAYVRFASLSAWLYPKWLAKTECALLPRKLWKFKGNKCSIHSRNLVSHWRCQLRLLRYRQFNDGFCLQFDRRWFQFSVISLSLCHKTTKNAKLQVRIARWMRGAQWKI